MHALKQMNLDPWLCRVHLCGWSQSRVYGITLPTEVKWHNNAKIDGKKDCIGVVVNAVTFVLKVVADDQVFKNEKTTRRAEKPSFLLGTLSFCDGGGCTSVPAAIPLEKVTAVMRAIRVLAQTQ